MKLDSHKKSDETRFFKNPVGSRDPKSSQKWRGEGGGGGGGVVEIYLIIHN